MVFKLEVLARQYKFSDREVMMATRFNIAYRLFLGLSLKSPLPHHTTMTYFRQRLGEERLQEVFDTLVAHAAATGLGQGPLATEGCYPHHRQYRRAFDYPPCRPSTRSVA